MSLARPCQLLDHFRLKEESSVYSIGSFSSGVTVRSQQIRALNLAYSLIELRKLRTSTKDSLDIAVIGAGFSGLTFVAALLKKEIACTVTLLEEHDTLLPLQQGNDSRWLHPHIYEWPDKGSEADVAMLPIMNWTAARASDVVVQLLREWKQVVQGALTASTEKNCVALYCNTRHLQLTKDEEESAKCRLEWIGERRSLEDGTTEKAASSSRGRSRTFDLVVLAVGFGIEKGTTSYWRNDFIGQPLLNQPRRTYLISGQGDGALIDLVRVRLSQYRQDRILEEVFFGKKEIVDRLSKLKKRVSRDCSISLFREFDNIFLHDNNCKSDSEEVQSMIARRLRRDTDAILKICVPDIANLLQRSVSSISFQNALLTYLLYLVGGFTPSNNKEADILRKYSIPKEFVVRRHGTDRASHFRRFFQSLDVDDIDQMVANGDIGSHEASSINWPGGYFDHRGSISEIGGVESDEVRARWRREYLPGPTTLVTAAICSSVVGSIVGSWPTLSHLRVTMHRVLLLNDEVLLQQTCDYEGLRIPDGGSTRGRTFLARNAMIGLAFGSHQPVHTRKAASSEEFASTMRSLGLHDAARSMAPEVSYVLALPILQPSRQFYEPSRVAAILYLDSKDPAFFLGPREVGKVAKILCESVSSLERQSNKVLLGVRNIAVAEISESKCQPQTELKDGGGGS